MRTLAKKKTHTVRRLLKTVFQFYPVILPLTVVCIIFNGVISSIPALFMQNIIAMIEDSLKNSFDLVTENNSIFGLMRSMEGGVYDSWSVVGGSILRLVGILAVLYVFSLLSGIIYNQLMAVITQGTLKKLRVKLFRRMQEMPISYFDTHNHGDIMSHYTNDIDTLRQMISQSFPQLLISGTVVVTIFCIMIYLCLWLAIVVVAGVLVILVIIKRIGGGSAKYFVRQQKSLGEVEGYVEEIMNGQKVVKVFCHERASEAEFDALNDKLFREAEKANKYANTLPPILNNVGNVLYVIVAVVGGALILFGTPNVSISGIVMGVSVVIPFLNMTKQFVGNINQVSQQINAVIMGLAGAERVFALLDEPAETDDGHVYLVNVTEENGAPVECTAHTGHWAWKRTGGAPGEAEYTRLTGDVALDHVDFSYEQGKEVLHDITLEATPGQKVAFVGATGAGKTTIANLLNRFYDIAEGDIQYDGVDIKEIRKSDLRRSIGIVLQETSLFTATVMENIRYGRLDASDEECVAAAKLAGADDFITRLPEGYQTVVSGNGENLSQGQRQLLAISRAAVADPPVMILDEATSSIDTRTEAIVQRGMDALMAGRTVFVIAHRLSTVKNADRILVMEHGRIIERGTHAELIEKKGQYYQLYTGAFELE
ncbi:MAG: ABC transporter ATP-binding protein/permease [Oscillospiraceae bacterium]|nr:ABC transporter ATP-binding protein/permease [Oscillospiraceae bacterium]